MADTQDYTDELIDVAGTRVQVLKGGSGTPLLFLHGAGGNPGWLPYHQALAQQYTVYAPSHPGYDRSSRPDWISTMTDMAHFYRQFIEALGIAPVHLMGSSMGGWPQSWLQCVLHTSRAWCWWMPLASSRRWGTSPRSS